MFPEDISRAFGCQDPNAKGGVSLGFHPIKGMMIGKNLNVDMRRFLGGCMSWNKFTPGKNIKIINLLGANYPTAILR